MLNGCIVEEHCQFEGLAHTLVSSLPATSPLLENSHQKKTTDKAPQYILGDQAWSPYSQDTGADITPSPHARHTARPASL